MGGPRQDQERAEELERGRTGMLDRLREPPRWNGPSPPTAGHELRTLLTRIRGELDVVLRSGVPEPPREQLEWMRDELDRLSRVCGRLLLLVRLDHQARDASLMVDQVDLEELVLELLDQMSPVARDRGVALQRGRLTGIRVWGSRPLLVEAVQNLLDNAIRATPGGTVRIAIDAGHAAACLSVEDDGPGVPPEERERIFQPFYRIQRAGAGLTDERCGMGLAIVRAIARAHGGRIDVIGSPGGGTAFRLVLPCPSPVS